MTHADYEDASTNARSTRPAAMVGLHHEIQTPNTSRGQRVLYENAHAHSLLMGSCWEYEMYAMVMRNRLVYVGTSGMLLRGVCTGEVPQ